MPARSRDRTSGPTATVPSVRRPSEDRAAAAPAASRPVSRARRRSDGRALAIASVLTCFWYDGALLGSARAEAFADAQPTCEGALAAAAKRYDIPLAVFYAVGLNESGQGGRLKPYAMNIDGTAAVSATLPEALMRFRQAKAKGARMIDIGCMQINHHYHGARFATLEAMFDPAQNIDYAARFLRELKSRERSWTMAVARYNAGPDNDPAQKIYVCNVMLRMVASGFGRWTESARKFCFNSGVAQAQQ